MRLGPFLPNVPELCFPCGSHISLNPTHFMDVDALNVRAILMSSDVSEEERIRALAQILESIDSGFAFPQLVTDSLIAYGIDRKQGSPSVKMLSYEILGAIASDGDAKASEGIMESVRMDLANPSGEVVYSALDALNALTGSFLVRFVHTIDMEKIVRKSLENGYPMVRKQAVHIFSLLALRCLCSLSGLAFKDEAFDSSRGRAEQIQETITKCREILRCVAEALQDSDARVVAECCKSLYMLIEENNSHIYSRIDEGFNYHTSEEARETLTISPSLVWDLIPDVGELLLAQTYTIASRISQVKGLEAAYMIEGISEALLLALKFNEAAGYEWTPRMIRLEHLATPQMVPCDEVACYWVREVLVKHLCDGNAESMFMAAKYTILLSHFKLMSVNKQTWACAAFVALMRVMQSRYGVIDPVEVAELLVVAIQHLPKDLYFPENDSLIQSLYGQTGIPNTRDLILISREPEKIQKELFNIPTVSVCYRAIYSVRDVSKRIALLLSMARSLVKSMLRDGNTDYAQKVMKSVFIANIFKQEDGDIFKEEIVSSLLAAVGDEKPAANAPAEKTNTWAKVTLNVLFSTSDCLTWPSSSGTAADRYLNALFNVGSFITERSDEHADEEDDGEPPKVLFQRVLKHNILQVLPSVVDASLRLQAIWILAQFVVSSDLQKVLLGLVLQRLGKTDTQQVVSNERFAKSQHTSLAMAGSILEDHQQTANEDLVLSDLLLRCVLHIVSDNEELAEIAYRAIQEYLKRKDICMLVRENAMNMLARISLSLPKEKRVLDMEEDDRLNSVYSFVGSYSPLQDTDATKQQKIQNIRDPAEIYRQSIQNALVTTKDEENDEAAAVKAHVKGLVYKVPAVHIRSTLAGSSDPLLIVGSFRPQSETHQLILRMTLYNATHVDMSGIAVSVAAQGALGMSSLRREAHFEMKGVLRPRASVTWEAPLEVSRFERGTAQPLVTLRKGEEDTHMMDGSIKEGLGDLVLPYTPIQIKFTDLLLLPPSHLLQTQNFRSLWDRLGNSVTMDAIIDQAEGQTLSEHLACERVRGPEQAVGYVTLPEIPTGNHMQVAGLSRTWNGDWLAFYCIGAYTVRPEEVRTPMTTGAETATTVTPEEKVCGVWRVQYEFRSSSEQVMEALRANSQMWLDDLTDQQVTLVSLYNNCLDESYDKKEGVEFLGLSNMQIESDMSTDDVLYKWNVLKRQRKNRYVEVEEEGDAFAEDDN